MSTPPWDTDGAGGLPRGGGAGWGERQSLQGDAAEPGEDRSWAALRGRKVQRVSGRGGVGRAENVTKRRGTEDSGRGREAEGEGKGAVGESGSTERSGERKEGGGRGRLGPPEPSSAFSRAPWPQGSAATRQPPACLLPTWAKQGEALSPLPALFSFQEGSGARCCGWDVPWLCVLFPDCSGFLVTEVASAADCAEGRVVLKVTVPPGVLI